MSKNRKVIEVILMLILVVVTISSNALAGKAPVIMLILDASGSMWGEIEGGKKIDIAKSSLSEVIDGLPDDATVGLISYGHRTKGDCNDVEEIISLAKINKENLKNKINGLIPKGKTPITFSIQQAIDSLKKFENESSIILVSDGMETCDQDPCNLVKELNSLGIKFVMNVIGFDVSAEERQQLECIANESGGKYYSANNVNEFEIAAKTVAKESVAVSRVKTVEPSALQCAAAPCSIAELDATFEAELLQKDHKMFYRVEVPAQGYLRAEVSNVPKGNQIGYHFLDSKATEIMKSPSSNAINVQKGTYYIGLYERWGKSLAAPIHAKIVFIKEMDLFEANNSVNNAKPVALGEEISFATYPRWDKDYFKIEAPSDGYINVVISEGAKGVEYKYHFAELIEGDSFKADSIKTITDTSSTNSIRVTKGTYIIGIYDRWEKFPQSLQQAKAKIFFIEEVDGFESNDSPQEAKPVALNEEFSFATYPRGDKDYFKINAPGDGYINVVISEGAKGVAYKYHFVAPGNEDAFKTASLTTIMDTSSSNSIRVTKGTYIIGIYDRWNKFPQSLQEAKSKIYFIEEVDFLEPNNQIKSAAPIKLDREYEFAIYPRNDNDFYRIDVPKEGKLQIMLTESTEGLNYIYHFYDSTGNKLQATYRSNSLTVKPGTYIVGLSDRWNHSPKNLQRGKFKVLLVN